MILRLDFTCFVICSIIVNSTICLKIAHHNTLDVRYNGFSGSNRKQNSPDDGIICNNLEQERFLDFTVQSSYNFLLNPGTTINSCRRLFIPSDPSGILVRLTKLTDDGTLTKSHNASSICPITIENAVNSAPWKVDPCGDKGVQEYWRIFEGNLNFYWEHQSNNLAFVISFSKVEYGEVCTSEKYHICPKFNSNLAFCIHSNLVCDGLRQCPNGAEMTDDESMCEPKSTRNIAQNRPTKTKKQLPGALKFILLGAVISLVALSIFVIWEHARRSNESDRVFTARNQDCAGESSILNDAPPAYSTLFPGKKIDVTSSKEKLTQSTNFLPSAPEIESDNLDFKEVEFTKSNLHEKC